MDVGDLRILSDLSAVGVLGLFILVTGYLANKGLQLFREGVIPLARNHLEHMEASYDKMSESIGRQADALVGMKGVQASQSEALSAHNELTRILIDRLRLERPDDVSGRV